ncbi:CDP-alcohol phosphatidyltransferase family protein [Brooklawnia cerclae]|uniref:Phosphatidylinositol phosphate synthase n=1 Tax=Brooklawnia cerclae TaxID=349934 RepID=A0ABX0SJF0_9ACTN|nr:CDP-alcohol phosphatidyltransferase family protein [Brooklawnia cerclae]NIH56856.1 CDP-diacylglycerol--glycerol-3-phosphate 3-phosphatidyltransferase [Brooklawnia cerclae]
MLEKLRSRWTRVILPPARGLLRLGISPDVVTWVGTVATVAIALICFPRGWLWQGVAALVVFIFSDSLDGTMARESGRSSRWGAFLDSTLDRIADGAIFGGLALYFAGPGDSVPWAAAGIGALVFGQVTSYTKARGESLGIAVNGGLAGRADRLLLGLLGALLTGLLGLDWILAAVLIVLCVAGAFTVGQRMVIVQRGIRAADEDI